MKLVRWNGDSIVTDSVVHYNWEPGTVYKLKNAIADRLLTNSLFSIVEDEVDDIVTPDEILESEVPEYDSE